MNAPFQLFKPVDQATEAAMRASFARFGILSPISLDQHGRILDGHQRKRIADDLGIECPSRVFEVKDDEEAEEVARTLNEDRRQLSPEERRPAVADLRDKGHSIRAIAGAMGVSKAQVERDLAAGVPPGTPEEKNKKIKGVDGKQYPAHAKKAAKAAAPKSSEKKKDAPDFEALYHRAIEERDAAREAAETARELQDQLSALECKEPDEQQKEILRLKQHVAKLEAEIGRLNRARADCQTKCNELIRQVKSLQRKAK